MQAGGKAKKKRQGQDSNLRAQKASADFTEVIAGERVNHSTTLTFVDINACENIWIESVHWLNCSDYIIFRGTLVYRRPLSNCAENLVWFRKPPMKFPGIQKAKGRFVYLE